MSSYTLELRHIHQTHKVFNFDYDFYTDSDIIKSKFEEKFIDEYFFHEIGQETVARFQHRLRTRLNKIMPYYKQLYNTELASKDINFLLLSNFGNLARGYKIIALLVQFLRNSLIDNFLSPIAGSITIRLFLFIL